MKTKLLLGNVYKYMFLLWFLGFTLVSYAQCPLIPNPTPAPICDSASFTFSDLNTYATDMGNGIVWYDAPTGGTAYNANQLVYEGTYYAGDNSGSCGTRLPIIVDFEVDASGENLDKIYCSNENATIQTYIDDVLAASIPSGGSVEVYRDFSLTNQAVPADVIPVGAQNYFIIFVDNSNCKGQIEIGQVGVFSAPQDPTPQPLQVFCSNTNPLVGNLDPGTASTNFNWYENIDGFGNPVPPALSSTTALTNGGIYYVQVDDIFCESNVASVTVNIETPPNSGTSASLEYCNDSLPTSNFDLFDELGGIKDTNGTWSGPVATSNGFRGTVNIAGLTTGGLYIFSYTVPATTGCPQSSSTVAIQVYETFSSGAVSTLNPTSFCVSALPTDFDLFTLLENEDLNGQWTIGTNSTDPVTTSTIDLSSYTVGSYNFTYTQNLAPNPCPEESTTVQVTVLQDPNAGNAINQSFCENDLSTNSPFNLFDALDNSQDNNAGTWRDASNTTVSNSIDITSFTVAGSPYIFTYTIDNGACSDTEQITITIDDAPESGIANAPVEFCEGSAPSNYNLFDLIAGEDQTGTWLDDNATGVLTGNIADLSGLTPATYNFTFDVDAIGSCDDANVTVSVVINPLPNTGIPSPVAFCENDVTSNSPLDLFGQLTGEDAGGIWTDDDTSRALTGSNVDLTLLAIGSYSYTYAITDANGCSNSSTVVITIDDAPESGTANAPVEFCVFEITTGQTYNLFDLIEGEDQTGTWLDDDASGALSGNTVTLDGLTQGTYNFTFDVDAIGSCDDVDVTVSIIINDTTAPSAASPQAFCDSATVADLVVVGNSVQWYNTSTAGAPIDVSTALVDGQTYYVSQTNATTGCESSTRTAVTVAINQTPTAGALNATTIIACNDSANINLFTGLDGTQDNGGTWTNDDSVGVLVGNTFNATGVAAGTYSFTYTVTASAPCVDDSITISVTIETPLNAGTDGAPLNLCSNNGTVDLFSELGGNPDAGGTWSPAMDSSTGVFNPLVDAPGTYTYTLSNACGTFSSSIEVSVSLAPNAGEDNSVNLCETDAPVDLFTYLGTAAQSGGTWSPALTSGTGVFDPAVDVANTYTYTVTATSPCSPDAMASVVVSVNNTPMPTVTTINPEFCAINQPIVSDLDTNITSSGTINWYEDVALTTPLTGTELLINGDDYYVTQTNTSGCESEPVQISVTINDAPTPILTNTDETYCINDNPTINELANNVSYDASAYNIIWYDEALEGTVLSGSDVLSKTTTVYYAALIDLSTGCESSVRLAVTPDITGCGKVELPDGFSPNGDGVNDTYNVDNLSILYPNFEIEIFNRNGNVVYKGNANSPRFDGTSNQSRTLIKGDLPVGVYFYIFKFNDGEHKPEQGRLYLSR